MKIYKYLSLISNLCEYGKFRIKENDKMGIFARVTDFNC